MKNKLMNVLKIENDKRILMFDFHNLVYRTLHIAFFECPEDKQFLYWKYILLNSFFTTIKKMKPSRVVVAIDDTDNWRKKIYPQYKLLRKDARNKSRIDFDAFFVVLDDFIEGLKKTLPNIYFIKVNNCEGDDIIATLAKHHKEDKTILISTDKDFIQLMKRKKFKIFNPKNNDFVHCLNPLKELECKIIMGDKSDNINAIKSRVGIKTAQKLFNEGLDELLKDKEIKKKYELNRQLIDMDLIPMEYQNKILNTYKNYKLIQFNAMTLLMFLAKNKIKKIADNINTFVHTLKKLD